MLSEILMEGTNFNGNFTVLNRNPQRTFFFRFDIELYSSVGLCFEKESMLNEIVSLQEQDKTKTIVFEYYRYVSRFIPHLHHN